MQFQILYKMKEIKKKPASNEWQLKKIMTICFFGIRLFKIETATQLTTQKNTKGINRDFFT